MLIFSLAIVFTCNCVQAQNTSRDVSSVDVSVHAGIGDQAKQQEPQSSPLVKRPTTISSWSPGREKQSSTTIFRRPAVGTSVPASRSAFQPASTTGPVDSTTPTAINHGGFGRPDVSSGPQVLHVYGNPSSTLTPKAVVLPPTRPPESNELFAPFDRRPVGSFNNYSFSGTDFPRRESTTIHAGQHKLHPHESTDRHNLAATPASVSITKP
jgi:hypothetical protein